MCPRSSGLGSRGCLGDLEVPRSEASLTEVEGRTGRPAPDADGNSILSIGPRDWDAWGEASPLQAIGDPGHPAGLGPLRKPHGPRRPRRMTSW